jgi:GNAT superfamily N-acetyltransferase
MLTRRGYLLVGFEHVLGLVLQPGAWPAPQPEAAVQVTRTAPEQTGEFLRLVTAGFSHPDGTGTPSHETFSDEALLQVFEDFAAAPSMRRYLARWDGTPAGGGTLRLGGSGVAQLAGASTLPRFRRRGVQSALLHARLTDALREGYDLAVVTTQPGSKSQENAHRHGFSLLYARAVLVRK